MVKMKIGLLFLCLIAMALFIKADSCSDLQTQLTQMQMQAQVDRANFNAQFAMLNNQTQASMLKLRSDAQADTKLQLAEQNQFIMQQNLAMIDAILMRVVVALFATSGWFFSLAMLVHYGRL